MVLLESYFEDSVIKKENLALQQSIVKHSVLESKVAIAKLKEPLP
jgi:hypothetical protein